MKLKLPVAFAWEWLAQATALAGLYLSFAWMGSVAAVAAGSNNIAGNGGIGNDSGIPGGGYAAEHGVGGC